MSSIIEVDNIDEFNKKAADILEESISKLLINQEKVVFGVPGGRSVAGIFNELGRRNIKWEKVHIFMVDERVVPINDTKSNFKLAKENFIGELMNSGLLPEKNVHPFIVGEDYGAELKKNRGTYDIVLLSSGEDGHIAGLFPDHHSVKDNSDFFIVMNDSPKLPKDRVSASRKLLMKSKIAILLFFGKIKKKAYRKFMDKNINVNSCPAKMVLGIKDSYVITYFNN